MLKFRSVWLVLPLILAASTPELCSAGHLRTTVSCGDGTHTDVHWTYTQGTYLPADDPPNWVGYDVYRRSIADCSAYVRVNAEPFPHVTNTNDSYTFTDTPPLSATLYNYAVVLVDANRNGVSYPTCEICVYSDETSCPEGSAPVTHGTLEDWGWALYVRPCVGSCYQNYFFSYYEPYVEQLRSYAGTNTAVRLFGNGFCGTVEGCEMYVNRYEIVPCDGPTRALPMTWGRVKTIYR